MRRPSGGDRFFCALASRANGEALHGTVANIRSWLLLEYPGAWTRNAVEGSALSGAVKHHIRELERCGYIDRPLLVRREHTPSPTIRCFFVDSCGERPAIMRTVISGYEELCGIYAGVEPVDGLMYAVCTHGRHDKCCAKFGIPVFCALRDIVGRQVWQCSHVGGDRFAANVVVFPYGIYYGRIEPHEVSELVRRSEAGEIWLERYRGRSCFRRAAQVAEYFARKESGRVSIDEFRLIDTLQAGDVTRARFASRSDGSIHVVEFAPRPDTIAQPLTCTAPESSAIRQYDLVRYSVEKG